MFEELKKTYGIKDTFDNFFKYQDLFENWVVNRRKAATNYVRLFDYMENYNEIQTHIMTEFGKGMYDTIAIDNKRSLFYLFQSMYLLETIHQIHNQEITSQISSYLTNIQVTEHTDITHEISKQLKLVKKSIDRI